MRKTHRVGDGIHSFVGGRAAGAVGVAPAAAAEDEGGGSGGCGGRRDDAVCLVRLRLARAASAVDGVRPRGGVLQAERRRWHWGGGREVRRQAVDRRRRGRGGDRRRGGGVGRGRRSHQIRL